MEKQEEDAVIITKEKKVGTVLSRIRNTATVTAAISGVALLSKYAFNVPDEYSLALLISVGLPSFFQLIMWIIAGKKFKLHKLGAFIPSVVLYLFFMGYSIPKTVEYFIHLSVVFAFAHITAIVVGIFFLYFVKIIKKDLRLKLIVATTASLVLGLFLTLLWSEFNLL